MIVFPLKAMQKIPFYPSVARSVLVVARNPSASRVRVGVRLGANRARNPRCEHRTGCDRGVKGYFRVACNRKTARNN